MFALLSEDDLHFILNTQIPLVDALDAKKRSLAETFTTGGKKKVTEALAAITKLPELSPADMMQFAASARSCMSRSSCTNEHTCMARSASLLGCKFAILWHPEELQMDVGQQCMELMHGTKDAQTNTHNSVLHLKQLAACWAVWVMCNGGTVVASTAMHAGGEAPSTGSSGDGAVSACLPHVTKETGGEVLCTVRQFHLRFKCWFCCVFMYLVAHTHC